MDPSTEALFFIVSVVCPVIAFGLVGAAVWAGWTVRRRRSAGVGGAATPANPALPRPSPALPYRRAESLLTDTEAHFYRELVAALPPGYTVQCKVRLADLLLTPEGDLAAFRQVSQKHVDFAVCTAGSLRPAVCVELDDRSHQREDRQARDAFVDAAYAAARLPLVHAPVQHNYNREYLQSLLCPYL